MTMDVFYKEQKCFVGYDDGMIRGFDIAKQKIFGEFKLIESG